MSDTATPEYLLSTAFLRVFFRLFNRSEVAGRQHVPKSGGVLLIANHTSYAVKIGAVTDAARELPLGDAVPPAK